MRFSLPMLSTDACMVAESIGIIYDCKDATEIIELTSAFFGGTFSGTFGTQPLEWKTHGIKYYNALRSTKIKRG